MGNLFGKRFSSTSKSEDLQVTSNKPKYDAKETEVPKTSEPKSLFTTNADLSACESRNKESVSSVVSQSISANSTLIERTDTMTTVANEETESDLPTFLIVLLKDIADKEGFTDYAFEVSAGSNKHDGFLAIIKRVKITGNRNGVKDELSLICKLMPTSKARREQFNSDAVFIREAFMYSQLLPIFVDFQKEKGLSIEEGFNEYPKCYGTLDDSENDRFVIVLEDLKVGGYEMFDKFKSADFSHVKLFVESLGKFHSISFALKDQRPEVFGKFKHLRDVFAEQMETKPQIMGPMFSFFFDKAIAAFRPEDEVEIKALTKLKENVITELIMCGSGENSEPFSIVNHGDCWNNNMMYLYGVENKAPVNICLLDYQISRYSSPVLDLVYFFFSSTDKTLRDAHYNELIQLYYKSLSTNINKLGSDANKLFSFDDLQDQLKKFGRYALIVAPMLLNMITANPDDIPDLDNLAEDMANDGRTIEEGMESFCPNSSVDKFNERIRDVVQDILRLGYY